MGRSPTLRRIPVALAFVLLAVACGQTGQSHPTAVGGGTGLPQSGGTGVGGGGSIGGGTSGGTVSGGGGSFSAGTSSGGGTSVSGGTGTGGTGGAKTAPGPTVPQNQKQSAKHSRKIDQQLPDVHL